MSECLWTYEEDTSRFKPGCEDDGGVVLYCLPHRFDLKVCPYCGKPLKLVDGAKL